jgi:hypothetical protein
MGAPLTSYYRIGCGKHSPAVAIRRNAQSKEVNDAIKDAARALEHFSSGSLKKGLATNDSVMGVPVEVTAKTGRWKTPAVIDKSYDRKSRSYALTSKTASRLMK